MGIKFYGRLKFTDTEWSRYLQCDTFNKGEWKEVSKENYNILKEHFSANIEVKEEIFKTAEIETKNEVVANVETTEAIDDKPAKAKSSKRSATEETVTGSPIIEDLKETEKVVTVIAPTTVEEMNIAVEVKAEDNIETVAKEAEENKVEVKAEGQEV